MRKSVQILIAILSVTGNMGLSYGQYSVDYGVGAEALTERLGAEGMTVINAELNCDPHRHGTFEGSGDLGIDTGIVLSITNVNANNIFGDFGYYNSPKITTTDSSYMQDEDMGALIDSWNGGTTNISAFNTCALSIEFIPHYDSIGFDYIFADHLMSTSASGIFDVIFDDDCNLACIPIAAFLSGGSEYPEPINLATIPGHPDIPVNAYTINISGFTDEEGCSRENTMWADSDMPFTEYYVENYDPYTTDVFMDYFRYTALTTKFSPVVAVNPCDTYQIKIAIAQPATLGYCCGITKVAGASLFIDNLQSFGTEYDSCTSLSVDDLSRELALSVNPNPFSEQLKLNIGPGYTDRKLQLSVSDITGRTLLKADGNVTSLNKRLDGLAAGLNQGMYFISIQDKESHHRQVFKVVKE